MLSEKTLGRGDEGEFELILGNRQLLSVFFIVVVLLGVFFTMGYIVGKNSVTATELAGRKSDPVMVDPSRPSPQSESRPSPVPAVKPADLGELGSSPAPAATTPVDPPVVERPVAEKPVEAPRETKAPERPKPVETKPEVKPEVKPEAKAPPPAPARAAAGGVVIPAAGQQFLQVVATSKPDAEIIADVLRRKGFSSAVVPGPNDKVFRVVVGPLADASTISRTRSELEAAGFQKPILKRF